MIFSLASSGNSAMKFSGIIFMATASFLPLALFTSCGKDNISAQFTQLHTGTSNDLNYAFFLNDSLGYLCGGDRYFKGDLLKTTDGGFTWEDQSTADMTKALYHLHFLAEDTGFSCGYDGKIFRTTDGGSTWMYFQTDYFRPLRSVFMLNDKTGFACGGDGYEHGYLLTTSSGGDNWAPDTTQEEYRDVIYFNESDGVICGYGLIMHTEDGGHTWTYTNAKQDFFVDMEFVNDDVGYCIGYTGSIWKTVDGGRGWERLRNGSALVNAQWYLNCIAFRSTEVGYIAGEKGCLLKTTDGGNTWSKIENSPDVDWKGIALLSNGGIVCGAGGAVYRFID